MKVREQLTPALNRLEAHAKFTDGMHLDAAGCERLRNGLIALAELIDKQEDIINGYGHLITECKELGWSVLKTIAWCAAIGFLLWLGQ